MLRRAAVLALTIVIVGGATLLPAGASATILPLLSLDETAGSAAASVGSLGFKIDLNQSPGDAVRDLSILLPVGASINVDAGGGACLAATAPIPACQIGAGTAVIAGTTTPMSLYLVRPPLPADLAGVELVAGTLSPVGALTLQSSSDLGIEPSLFVVSQIAFSGLPAAPIGSLNFTLTGLTLPSSCRPNGASIYASSQQNATVVQASAAFTVTGCATLPYVPGVNEQIVRQPKSAGAVFTVELLDPPSNAVTQGVRLPLPANLSLNPQLDPCLQGQTCTVGTVTATSPVLPASELTGTITLSGTIRAPALQIAFPAPLGLQLASSFSGTGISLAALPDIPMTEMKLTFTGNALGPMFVAQCYPNAFMATMLPWSGNASVQVTDALLETGCPASHPPKPRRPTAQASLSGLAGGAPRLVLRVVKGSHAPGIQSLSILPPAGLSFSAHAVARDRRIFEQALALHGAQLASARVQGRALDVVFAQPAGRSSLSLRRPLLIPSAATPLHVGSTGVRAGDVTVVITDGGGLQTKLALPLGDG